MRRFTLFLATTVKVVGVVAGSTLVGVIIGQIIDAQVHQFAFRKSLYPCGFDPMWTVRGFSGLVVPLSATVAGLFAGLMVSLALLIPRVARWLYAFAFVLLLLWSSDTIAHNIHAVSDLQRPCTNTYVTDEFGDDWAREERGFDALNNLGNVVFTAIIVVGSIFAGIIKQTLSAVSQCTPHGLPSIASYFFKGDVQAYLRRNLSQSSGEYNEQDNNRTSDHGAERCR